MKNKDVLLKLINLKPADCIHPIFNFSYINLSRTLEVRKNIPNCGSAGCLLGELPGIDNEWSFDNVGDLNHIYYAEHDTAMDIVPNYFDLPYSIIRYLFYPDNKFYYGENEYFNGIPADSTLEEVQNHIKKAMESPELKHYFEEN